MGRLPWLKLSIGAVALILIGGSGLLLWQRQQQTSQIEQLQSDLTSTTYQLNQAQQALAATPTPTPTPTPTATPKPTVKPKTTVRKTTTRTPTPVPTKIP